MDVDEGGTPSSVVTCEDWCKLCRDDLGLCVTYEYRFDFVGGNLNTFTGFLQYSEGRTDLLQFQQTYSGNGVGIASCAAAVNGVSCNSCTPSTGSCTDGIVYDCSNIEANAVFDECTDDFEQIAASSIFVAYNENFFTDADCVFFGTTATPAPTDSKQQGDLIAYDMPRFKVGIEFGAVDDVAFVQAVIDYLTLHLSRFYPALVGVVLDRVTPLVGEPLYKAAEFILDGDAFFFGMGPHPKSLIAAVNYLLSDTASLQQTITDANVGTGVKVTYTAVLPPPSPPSKPKAPSKSSKTVSGPWYFRPKAPNSKGKGKGGMYRPQRNHHHVYQAHPKPSSSSSSNGGFVFADGWSIGGIPPMQHGYWTTRHRWRTPKSSKSKSSSSSSSRSYYNYPTGGGTGTHPNNYYYYDGGRKRTRRNLRRV
jgi:hypothetical protein